MDPHVLRADSWSSMCRQCESHAHGMAGHCEYPIARELIATITHKFCSQTPPTTEVELQVRRIQASAVSAIIASITHGNGMARLNARVAEEVFVETRKLVEVDLPRTDAEFGQMLRGSAAFSLKVAGICHAERMRQLRT